MSKSDVRAVTSDVRCEEPAEAVASSRRDFAALLGALGAIALAGCDDDTPSAEQVPPGEVQLLQQALTGSGTLKVADNAANLRIQSGTDTVVAVMQGLASAGDGHGGVFYWSTTAKADDGYNVLNASSGNSAGWRRTSAVVSELSSVLATRIGLADGEMRVCSGVAALGVGAGLFRWHAGDTSTAITGMVLGSSTAGRWKRVYSGPLDVTWFGALGNGVADSTAAFTAAIAEAVASGVRELSIPPGVFITDTVVIPAPGQFRIRGISKRQSVIKAKYPYSGGAAPSGSAAKGVIEINTPGTVHDVQIENLTINGGYSWAASTVVDPNHMRHGIYLNPGSDSNECRIIDVMVVSVSGHGFRFNGGTFQSSCTRCGADGTGGDTFNVSGNNTLLFEECMGASMAHGHAFFRMNGGFPLIKSCNGLFTSGINPAIHRISWGVFGDGVSTCRPCITNCNIESFTAYGCFFYAGSFATFEGNTFLPETGCVTRLLHYQNVQPQEATIFHATNRVFPGTWGNPDTQAADGQSIYCFGAGPFISMNPATNSYLVNGLTIATPSVSNVAVSYANSATKHNNVTFGREYASVTNITNAMSPYTLQANDNYVDVDTSGGNVTINLGQVQLEGNRIARITKVTSDANTVTLDGYGGHTINGALTATISSPFVEKKLRGKDGTNWLLT